MLKWIKRLALLLLVLVVIASGTGWWLLRGSVPRLQGDLALPGLSAPVSLQRDALGVVTLDAANETDLARALGYVHAQERYFEMDLMRRSSAGELSELFGPVALKMDKERRTHRMRARVMQDLAAFAGDKLPQLQAYTDGVNAGLADLKVRPWPYLVLRQQPKPWELADSALTGYAMYFDLQDSQNTRELALARIKPQVPEVLFDLLTHDGTEWDAPLFGEARGNAPLPSVDQLDLRTLAMPAGDSHGRLADKGTPGSNNWAVAGALTKDGRAIVADDMHLGLRAPNIWFRARLRYADARAPGGKVDVSGFTLPGLPAVIVGSNGHIAWGFTNSYADTADWYRVTPCVHGNPTTSCDAVTRHKETIRVAGDDPVTLEVEETGYGPILHHGKDGKAMALRWVAHLPESINFRLADFAVAKDLNTALATAEQMATPAQNLVMGDAKGRIAWRIAGPLPTRNSDCDIRALVHDSAKPADAAMDNPVVPASCTAWSISTANSPVLADPANSRLWTANARVVDDEGLAILGDGGYALGARSRQIRDGLLAKQVFTEKDLLAIQLDDRSLFLERWWQLLQSESKHDANPSMAALVKAGASWQPRASIDSVSYRSG